MQTSAPTTWRWGWDSRPPTGASSPGSTPRSPTASSSSPSVSCSSARRSRCSRSSRKGSPRGATPLGQRRLASPPSWLSTRAGLPASSPRRRATPRRTGGPHSPPLTRTAAAPTPTTRPPSGGSEGWPRPRRRRTPHRMCRRAPTGSRRGTGTRRATLRRPRPSTALTRWSSRARTRCRRTRSGSLRCCPCSTASRPGCGEILQQSSPQQALHSLLPLHSLLAIQTPPPRSLILQRALSPSGWRAGLWGC
mmetsp:Transcript_26691/g.85762  ORF Transcript_26691/g.85762 Transcript_26691/m.85762 type:complete len:250 (+) Transcript_26691:1-750(+)